MLMREETVKILKECMAIAENLRRHYRKGFSKAKRELQEIFAEMLKDEERHIDTLRLLLHKNGARVK